MRSILTVAPTGKKAPKLTVKNKLYREKFSGVNHPPAFSDH
jgi:hypothetical protein